MDYIQDLKSEYISSTSFKIAASVKYDSKELYDNILEVLEADI